MDRKSLREFTHKAENFLTIKDKDYKQWVFRYTFLELEKDRGHYGDVTTQSVFPTKKQVRGKIIANEPGIVAGIEEIEYFLVKGQTNFRPGLKGEFQLKINVEDGQGVNKGDVIMEIVADVHDLLTAERVILNLLMRMSGVATYTGKIVYLVKDYDVLITPTRKTLWGLLDKKAVVLGGGGTHRLNLSDSIIVKDTHLDIMGRDFVRVLREIEKIQPDCRFVEIEVENAKEAYHVAEAFNRVSLKSIGTIMMDNMPVEEIEKAMARIREKGLYENLLFEASGGITEKNIVDYAKTGVDIISMGALTSGVKGLDMSMKIA